jgi:hypothetical protein
MSDTPTAPAMPTLADPGELGPSAAPAPAAPAAPPKPPAPDAPRGTYEQRRNAQDQAAAKPAAEAPVDPQAPQAPAPGEKVKVGEYEITAEELGAIMARQSQDDLRKASLPPTPADYKIALPEGMTLPGNATYRFDEAGNKASFDAAKAWAHGRGMSQSEFSEMMGLYASHHAAQEARIAEVAQAELKKAGANAGQRVDAISRWIRAEVGDADARPIISTLATNAHLKFYERLMTKQSSQGAASFSQSHRAPPDNNPIPGYENMSFEQRREAQDRNAARRR